MFMIGNIAIKVNDKLQKYQNSKLALRHIVI